MAGFERYAVVEPATSAAVCQALRDAIDDGSRRIALNLEPEWQPNIIPLKQESIRIIFVLAQARYRENRVEYVGIDSVDRSAVNLVALTGSQRNEPARVVVVRRT